MLITQWEHLLGVHHLYHPLNTQELARIRLLEKALHRLPDTAHSQAVRAMGQMIPWEEEATAGQIAVPVRTL